VRNSSSRPLTVFYGYPAELIAQWCGVSIATARRWKRGGAAPRPALRLFTLYREQRVLDEYWKGWRAIKGVLYDPADTGTTQSQLAAYSLIMQFAADLARRDPESEQALYELLKRA
jgi:hypothetical protein